MIAKGQGQEEVGITIKGLQKGDLCDDAPVSYLDGGGGYMNPYICIDLYTQTYTHIYTSSCKTGKI